jgi:hypothetical protein
MCKIKLSKQLLILPDGRETVLYSDFLYMSVLFLTFFECCYRLAAAEKRRQREHLRRTKAVGIIFRIWRLYRFISFRSTMLAFVNFRRFQERIVDARDEDAFRHRMRKRSECEQVVFDSYLHRNGRLLETPGPFSQLSSFPSPRKAVDCRLDTAADGVSQWMADRLSPPRRHVNNIGTSLPKDYSL